MYSKPLRNSLTIIVLQNNTVMATPAMHIQGSLNSRDNLKPTVILRNLRTQGALSYPEPTRIQLNNKISHVKKKGNLNEPCNTTHDLRNKVKDFLENPVLEDDSWVPLCQIDDSGEGEVRSTVHHKAWSEVTLTFLSKYLYFLITNCSKALLHFL